ncbi:glycosyltransferase family 39 protein [Micromonospora eburnea]|uniref:glycosyltransferase family 39 protein n=1 Tax=Micromonospora eburnea TaxID=227316 RepID=UPI001FC9E41A|nr:glycosyltransferase family 39 protein [Micromonospora eburnea]
MTAASEPGPAGATGARRGWLVWAPPALLTLAVTLTGIGHAQPWRDELATWSAAARPVSDLVRLAGTIDAATGPYYLLLHGWIALAGASPTALRLPSALAVAGAAALTARLGERLAGPRAGLLAGLLLAVLPSTSRYGQEARPYALTALLAVAATLLLVGALSRPTWRRWTGYGLVVAALGLSHLIALSLLAAHALVVLLAAIRGPAAAGLTGTANPAGTEAGGDGPSRDRPVRAGRAAAADADRPANASRVDAREPRGPSGRTGPGAAAGRGGAGRSRRWARPRLFRRWLVALLPAVLLVTPLVLLAGSQRSRQLDWVDLARPTDLTGLPGGVAQSGVVGGLLVGLAALGAGRLGRRALLPGAAVLLPVLLLFAAGTAVPLWVARYLFFTVPFACLLAGAALAGVRLVPALAVVALAGALGLPDQAALRRTHEWPRTAPVDYRGAAQVIAAHERPGDAIVYSPRDSWLFLDLGMAYHLGSRQPRDALVVRDQRQRADLWASECARPAQCLAGVDRVWLVVSGRHTTDPLATVPGPKGTTLRDNFTVQQLWPRPGLTIALLTR